MSLSTLVLIALLFGLGGGLALDAIDPQVARTAAAIVEPVGTLFVNAIRMTVVPLVVSSLIVGIATSRSGAVVARSQCVDGFKKYCCRELSPGVRR